MILYFKYKKYYLDSLLMMDLFHNTHPQIDQPYMLDTVRSWPYNTSELGKEMKRNYNEVHKWLY